jgi:FkbM family methyltransferase
MKTLVKYILQKILGFRLYLFVFSLYITATLKRNRKEGDFLHFLSLLPDGSTVLDLGANIGVMSVHMARKLPKSEIMAFEPVPDNLENLHRLLRHYNVKNVKVYPMALGNAKGYASIILPEHSSVKFQGLSHIEGVEGTEGDTGKRYQVPMERLDDFEEFFAAGRRISGIKIDVENYEFEVLSGAVKLLERHRPLIYAELWENQNRTRCMELLTGIGYRIFVLQNGELVTFEAGTHQTQNFFFRFLPADRQ